MEREWYGICMICLIVCRGDLTFNLAKAFVRDLHESLDALKNAHVLCNEQKTGSYGFTY